MPTVPALTQTALAARGIDCFGNTMTPEVRLEHAGRRPAGGG